MGHSNIICILAGVTLFGVLIGGGVTLVRTKKAIDEEE